MLAAVKPPPPKRPPALRSGMMVRLVCPASGPRRDADVRRAVEQVRELGFRTSLGAVAARPAGGEPAGPEERRRELEEAFRDPEVDAVWALRGGYGCLALLPLLDREVFQAHPKVLLGYSDLSLLHFVLSGDGGLVTFHAPMPAEEIPAEARRHLLRLVSEPTPAGRLPRPADPSCPERSERSVPLAGGRAEGRLMVGNLTLLTRLLGTPFEPDFSARILCIEDVNEAPYRVHGLLMQLLLAGRLQRVAGIGLGAFRAAECAPEDFLPVFEELLVPLGVPVLHGLPLGHLPSQATLPCGVRAALDAEAGTLEILDPAVDSGSSPR